MLEIFLCDDEQKALDYYCNLIYSLAHKHSLAVHIHSFNSGEAFCFALEDNETKPDLIYLDILMEGMNGLVRQEFFANW